MKKSLFLFEGKKIEKVAFISCKLRTYEMIINHER